MQSNSEPGVLTHHVHVAFEASVHLKQISCFFFTPSIAGLEAVQVLFCHLQHPPFRMIKQNLCGSVLPCNNGMSQPLYSDLVA